MTLNAQRYLLAALLLAIAISAGLAALNVPTLVVPRAVFVVMMWLTATLTLALIFDLIYAPLRDRNYPQLLPNGILLFFFAYAVIKLSITGFDVDDEIYSWNMWAIQHFEGKTADFRFTVSPYPQLFSYWIAAIYHALGTISLHSVPRVFLAISALLLGMSVTVMAKIASWRAAVVTALILTFTVGPVIVRLAKGLADPLMSAAVILSAMLLITYAREPKKLTWLWLAGACAVIGALTKQAGLIWACFSLPLIVTVGFLHYKWPKGTLIVAATVLLISMIWPVWIAPTFTNNPGVINASMGNRSYLQQIRFAVHEYLIARPEILLLFVASALATWRNAFLRLLFFVGFLPMLAAWFLFGAYEIRLGIHVLGLAGLLTICALMAPMKDESSHPYTKESNRLPHRGPTLLLASMLTGAIVTGLIASVLALAHKLGTDLTDGASNTLRIQYGSNSDAVLDSLLKSKPHVWTTSNYAYGALYGRLPVGFPGYVGLDYTVANVKKELLAFKAEYAVYTGRVAYGPASELLKELAQKCPDALDPVLTPPNQNGFILYKVDLKVIASESCQ